MKLLKLLPTALALLAGPAFGATFNTLSGEAPIVIAHRGASGYLPEHTLEAYELGAFLGADYIEPDLVITSDGVAVALHDASLARTTNVESLFAPRNGGYSASEFTLAEIKTLTVEPVGSASTSYPGFTPGATDPFRVPTFREVLDLVNQYNATNGADIGVYPEVKANDPALNRIVVEELIATGFGDPGDKVFIQSFSFDTLRDIALIQEELGTDIAQVALGTALEVDDVFGLRVTSTTLLPLDQIALFADGLGVSRSSPGMGAEFISAAHALGMLVHAYTFNIADLDAASAQIAPFIEAGLDGFFSNFPDSGVEAVSRASVVPLPATGLLLISAIAALGFARRRKAA
ncbi:MAG: glycerophosphodiester phosphodiesterase family protein [Paracoccaceae bacterium]